MVDHPPFTTSEVLELLLDEMKKQTTLLENILDALTPEEDESDLGSLPTF